MHTRDELKRDLAALGIKRGDTVLLHSSYKSLGGIEGGAKAFFEVFLELLGDEGTLMLPTLSYNFVNSDAPYFNLRETPSCVGYLSEYFRTEVEGVKRSRHLTHSCCVIGKNADFLISEHELDETQVGPHSPFAKLPLVKGKILFLGCSADRNTSMHGVEESLNAPYYFHDTEIVSYIFDDGETKTTRTLPNCTFGKTGTAQRYSRIIDLLDENETWHGKVLDADCRVMLSHAVWAKGTEKMKEDPFFFVDCETKDELLREIER